MCAGYCGAGQLTRHCSAPAAPCGQQKQGAFPATLPPASAGQRPQDMGRPGRLCGQHGSSLSCQGASGLRLRPHAFHTRARRWNHGHFRRRKRVDKTSTLNKLASTPMGGFSGTKCTGNAIVMVQKGETTATALGGFGVRCREVVLKRTGSLSKPCADPFVSF
jgi:hypothetical protein